MPSLFKAVTRSSSMLSVLFALLLFNAPVAYAEEANTNGEVAKQLNEIELEQTQLIRQSLENDFFSQRCRGSSLAKYFNQTNRLFLSKYGFTANNYIRDYINPEVDVYKAELKQAFLKTLIKSGDCAGANELNWRKTMNDEYNRLYQDVEKSIWFPE